MFSLQVKGRPSIKDVIESLGVPHTEVGTLFINGRSRNFSYHVKPGDVILISPIPLLDNKRVRSSLQPASPRPLRFVLDSHLGKLARHLRLLGIDTVYRNDFPDHEIIAIAVMEKRVVVTRDIGLLKNKAVRHGSWLWTTDPEAQLKELSRRYPLKKYFSPFKRCLVCNSRIKRIAKAQIISEIEPLTGQHYQKFYRCQGCGRIYWPGAHYQNLLCKIQRAGCRLR